MRTQIATILQHFIRVDPKLADIVKQIDYEDWFEDDTVVTNSIFVSLCYTIVSQQLAGAAAHAIYSRFENLLDHQVTPHQILSPKPEDLRQVGLSWAKVRSVIDLSNKVIDKTLLLEQLTQMDDESLIENLVRVKGIGKWTAEMFLVFKMGREDIFSWGDLGLKKGLNKFLGSEQLPIPELQEYVSRWQPFRTYGAIAMWHLLDNR